MSAFADKLAAFRAEAEQHIAQPQDPVEAQLLAQRDRIDRLYAESGKLLADLLVDDLLMRVRR